MFFHDSLLRYVWRCEEAAAVCTVTSLLGRLQRFVSWLIQGVHLLVQDLHVELPASLASLSTVAPVRLQSSKVR